MSGMTRHPELDVEALRALTGAPSWHALARRMGADWRTLTRARAEGLTLDMADRWAVRCGLHPAEVWPVWVDLADDESCTTGPLERAARRRRQYHSDPSFREAEKARVRRYYAEASRVILAKRRADRERINARRRARRATA